MSLSFRLLFKGLIPVVMLTPLWGCSVDMESADSESVVIDGINASIAFEHDKTLTLIPGQVQDVAVRGKPAAHYEISFFLVGNSLDSSLDQTTVITDHDGRASVRLRAPNGATTFAVRATIKNGPSASLNVAVSDQGFATIDATPVYSGSRETTYWRAFAVAGTTCADLIDTLPDDPLGGLDTSGEPGELLLISDVPVGPNIAVVIRGEYYMWGCEDESNLVAGETTEVRVQVTNKPLDLSATNLYGDFEFAPDSTPWASMMLDGTEALLQPLCTPSGADLLLGVMSEQSDDPSEFDAASQSQQWPLEVDTYLQANDIDLCQALTTLASSGVAAQPPRLLGKVTAIEDIAGMAVFEIQQIGDVDADSLGIPLEYLMSWTADPDDTVRLGGSLFWMPTSYISGALAQAGMARFTDQDSLGAVMGEIVGCDEIGSLLGSYGDCEASCLKQLCLDGLAAKWQEAISDAVSWSGVGEIPLQASGSAFFDDHAAIHGFNGSWLGNVISGDYEVEVHGAVEASSSTEID